MCAYILHWRGTVGRSNFLFIRSHICFVRSSFWVNQVQSSPILGCKPKLGIIHTQTCRHITLMLCDEVRWWTWKVNIHCAEAWLTLVWGDVLFSCSTPYVIDMHWDNGTANFTWVKLWKYSAKTKTVSWQCSNKEQSCTQKLEIAWILWLTTLPCTTPPASSPAGKALH